MVDGVGSRGCRILKTFSVSSVRRRGGMPHNKRGEAIPGTDVTHFFSLSPKVGQHGKNIVRFQGEKLIMAPRAGRARRSTR
jgi:hypothetical protein